MIRGVDWGEGVKQGSSFDPVCFHMCFCNMCYKFSKTPFLPSESNAFCQLAWKKILADISVVRGSSSNMTCATYRTNTVHFIAVQEAACAFLGMSRLVLPPFTLLTHEFHENLSFRHVLFHENLLF